MDWAPDYYHKDILVLGCGNILFGDDGFGNAVADSLNEDYVLPSNMAALDVGTSVREVIFNMLLSEKRPRTIILVDALESGRQAGEVFIAKAEDVTANKMHDFSLHMVSITQCTIFTAYKIEVINFLKPWKGLNDVECATLDWVY